MKKITTMVITVSSQLLVVFVFLFLLFGTVGSNKNVTIIANNNFNKMADRTLVLFEEEKKNESSMDDTVVPLEDEKTKAQEVVEEKKEEDKKVEVKEKIVVTPEPNLFYDRAVIKTEVGTITGYGPDCAGCSGITASGHNLHESIYYNDLEFGTVRILAADKSIPFYSIFRVSNIPGMDPFLAIVLDTGGNVGYGKGTLFDLAHANEQNGVLPKTSNVTFEMLRSGK